LSDYSKLATGKRNYPLAVTVTSASCNGNFKIYIMNFKSIINW